MYAVVSRIAKLLLGVLGKYEVRNKNFLPSKGGYIVTCTHTGWLDVVILAVCLPRPIHFMAKQELFHIKLLSAFLRKLNAFPVNRENPSPSSIKIPVKLLKSGEVVGIFPGGTRTTEDVALKRGAITIASLAKVPVVPAIYEGPRTIRELLKVRKATITFGEPFYVESKTKEELALCTVQLSEQMNALQSGRLVAVEE
ncbi:lysophospholipid acyltransferase family protein [Sporosarcina cyprini]|uniref:lysophospholipid acyltransferase family protein n=1 Tax=Sporosarcina cyprini TaxID=2910523 RepID=UPI001EDFC14D|nr:lysophospholipid acyltransferase family protein [Sporosarcina cyprini]MCG3088913.1 1-acyl-sn-glycerol-3-phosphate acyltransferase [Sporosarcina cyprini]